MQKIDVLTWPPQPLHLHPMEHVWALVGWKLNEYPTPTKEMLQLWGHVQTSFHSINHGQCQKFYHSMRNLSKLLYPLKKN